MLDIINKLNDKVELTKRQRPSEGYINGCFPLYSDAYPCMTEFSSRYWQQVWHKDRGIEYYKCNDFWLSKQIFTSVTLSKPEGKVYLNSEYYSYINTISIIRDNNYTNNLFIELNKDLLYSCSIQDNIINLDINYILMIGDYLTIYLENNESGIIQIQYRIIG